MKEEKQTIYTSGKLFSDGTSIDMLSNDKLALWEEGGRKSAKVVRQVKLGNVTYRPTKLAEPMRSLLRLPSRVAPSCGELVPDLLKFIKKHASLDDGAALLVAAFVLATWVMEQLPSALCLNLWGPPGSQERLVALLACLCRRAIRVVDPSVRQLSKLPVGVLSTLILTNPSRPNLTHLLSALGTPDAVVLQGGGFVNLRYATIVSTQEPVSAPVIYIRGLPAGRGEKNLSSAEAGALAEHFQPRLLAYRFNRQVAVSSSEVDASDFEPEIRLMVRTLGAALEGSWPRLTDVARALEKLDQQAKSKRSHSLAALTLEALLALYHSDQSSVYVLHVADLVNTIAMGRHDPRGVTARKVGSILRKKLGLAPDKSTSRGFAISFDNDTARRIHRLAASYSVLSRGKECELCREQWPPDEDANNSSGQVEATPDRVDVAELNDGIDLANEQNVHNVHNVHDTHDTHDTHDPDGANGIEGMKP